MARFQNSLPNNPGGLKRFGGGLKGWRLKAEEKERRKVQGWRQEIYCLKSREAGRSSSKTLLKPIAILPCRSSSAAIVHPNALLRLDLNILLRTIPAVLKGSGAS